MTTVKIDFTIIIDETNDQTFYEVWANGSPFATIGAEGNIIFHPYGASLPISDRMRVLALAWNHWDALDSWSDISFEIPINYPSAA